MSRAAIGSWLHQLYADADLTHMLVVCDTFDWNDYPVYVTRHQDVREREKYYRDASMQRVMEIYSANHSWEAQMAEDRAFHYD